MATDLIVRRRLQDGWILPALLSGFPLWWALGLGELIFPIAGIALAISLLRSRSVIVPRHFGLYGLFIAVVAASAMMLDENSNVIGWAIRISQYASVGLLVPYVLTNRRTLTAARVLRALVWMWVSAIALGTLALVTGPVSFPTPMRALLPGTIIENAFVHEQVTPSLADVDDFLGFTSIRPKAPFTYTNGWGAALGLLFPVAVYAALRDVGVNRWLVRVSLVVGAVPITMSLNRGLWVSIVAAVVYGSLTIARSRGGIVLARLLVASIVVAAAIAVSPLGSLIQSRTDTPHSNEARGSLYLQVIDEVKDSPFIGYGGPRVREEGPPLGTHGQLWIVLFSYGLLGAGLYFAFMFIAFMDSGRPRTEVETVVHVVLAVSLLQVFFYGHIPQQLAIIMSAIGVSYASRIVMDRPQGPGPQPSALMTGYGAADGAS